MASTTTTTTNNKDSTAATNSSNNNNNGLPLELIKTALALTMQDWTQISLNASDPQTAATGDLQILTERITSLLLIRIVAAVHVVQKAAAEAAAIAAWMENPTSDYPQQQLQNQQEEHNQQQNSTGPQSRRQREDLIYENLSTSTICTKLMQSPYLWPAEIITEQVIEELRMFVHTILAGYKSVPYHNREHAYHVVVSINKLLDLMLSHKVPTTSTAQRQIAIHRAGRRSSNQQQRRLAAATLQQQPRTFGLKHDALAQLALVFAALIHDVEHTGIPNRQLVVEDDFLAIQYNDESIAEHRSLHVAFSELLSYKDEKTKERKYNELRRIMFFQVQAVPKPNTDDESYSTLDNPNDPTAVQRHLWMEQQKSQPHDPSYRHFRKMVINLVLNTDIASPERTQIAKSKWKEAFGNVVVFDGGPLVLPLAVSLRTAKRNSNDGGAGVVASRHEPTSLHSSTINAGGGAGSAGGAGDDNDDVSSFHGCDMTHNSHSNRAPAVGAANQHSTSEISGSFAADDVVEIDQVYRQIVQSMKREEEIEKAAIAGVEKAHESNAAGSNVAAAKVASNSIPEQPEGKKKDDDSSNSSEGGEDANSNASLSATPDSSDNESDVEMHPIQSTKDPSLSGSLAETDEALIPRRMVPARSSTISSGSASFSSNNNAPAAAVVPRPEEIRAVAIVSVQRRASMTMNRRGGRRSTIGSSRRGSADTLGSNTSSINNYYGYEQQVEKLTRRLSDAFLQSSSAAAGSEGNAGGGAKTIRKRLGIRRSMDFSGEVIDTYSRRSSLAAADPYSSSSYLESRQYLDVIESARPVGDSSNHGVGGGPPARDRFSLGDPSSIAAAPLAIGRNSIGDGSVSNVSVLSASSNHYRGKRVASIAHMSYGGMEYMDEDNNDDDVDADEPDELMAEVVMETIMTAADVAHNLQGWEHMVKWSSRLYLELRKAYMARRGTDPQPKWFENQIGFLDFYLLPLARRMGDMGVFGDAVGLTFARIVIANKERWLVEGMGVTATTVEEGAIAFPATRNNEVESVRTRKSV